jgi:hypothetical protein
MIKDESRFQFIPHVNSLAVVLVSGFTALCTNPKAPVVTGLGWRQSRVGRRAIGQGNLNHHAPIFLNSFDTRTWRDQMNWFSVQMNAAIIAGSLNISLIIALVATIITNRKVRQNFKLEFAAEGVAREMLMDRKLPYRTFRVLKYHLSGFTDDELRKILVRAGGIRLSAGGQEVWGLLSRNRKYLSVDEIKEPPTTQIAFDTFAQQQKPQHDGGPQDELDLPCNSSGAFERVRAEMIKLGTLECVRPAARQK